MAAKPSAQEMLLVEVLAARVLLAVSSWGQNTINAQVTGGGGNGKCTFEVRVDGGGVANVQIRGNQGYLQTRGGVPGQWKRLKCNRRPCPATPTTSASPESMAAAGSIC